MPRCKTVDIASLPVVGGGVEVRPSRIAGAGNGLFASRAFAKGDVVTFVDGPVVSDSEVRKRDKRDPSLNTHVVTLMSHFLVVDALRSPQEGRGGGSFANDPLHDRKLSNVQFEVCDCRDPERFNKVVVLRALRDIEQGEEILVSYGPGYWRRFPGVAAAALESSLPPSIGGGSTGSTQTPQAVAGDDAEGDRQRAAVGGSSTTASSTAPLTPAQVDTLARLAAAAAGHNQEGGPPASAALAPRAMQDLAVGVTPTTSVAAAAVGACRALFRSMWAMRNGRYDAGRAASSSALDTDEKASTVLRAQRGALHAPLAVLVVDAQGGVRFVLGRSGRMQPKPTPTSSVAVVALDADHTLASPVAFHARPSGGRAKGRASGAAPSGGDSATGGALPKCGDMLSVDSRLLPTRARLALPRASVMLALARTGLSLKLLDEAAFGVL